MKKLLKFLIIFIIIVVVLTLINTIRNIYIINKIKNNSSKYFSDMNSYKLTINSEASYAVRDSVKTNNTNSKTEIFYKNNKYLVKNYINDDELGNTEWQDYNTDKINYAEIIQINYYLKELLLNNNLKIYLLNIIKTDKDNYIINFSNELTLYFNKENGLLSKYTNKGQHTEFFSIEKNTVIDIDL